KVHSSLQESASGKVRNSEQRWIVSRFFPRSQAPPGNALSGGSASRFLCTRGRASHHCVPRRSLGTRERLFAIWRDFSLQGEDEPVRFLVIHRRLSSNSSLAPEAWSC